MLIKKIIFAAFFLIAACDHNTTDGFTVNDPAPVQSLMADGKLKEVRNPIDTPKKLIKNGNISFQTKDMSQTKVLIQQLVKKYKGYIASENESNYEHQLQNFVTIKVPEYYFDSIIHQLSKNVKSFENKDVSITDVTESYVDIDSRLKTKKELEKKYLEILQKAKSVQEILAVETELGKIREEIEAAQGRMNVLTNQIEFATLNIRYFKTSETSIGFGNQIIESFKNGIKLVKNFFLFVISLWPFAILMAFVLIFVKRFKRKK